MLGALGYEPGARDAGAVSALAGVYGFAPLALKVAAIALLWRWRHAIEPGCSRASPLVSARRRRIGGENGGRQADEPVCSKHEWEPKLPPTFLWFKPEQLIELTLELHKRGPDQSFSLLILRGFGDDVLGRD